MYFPSLANPSCPDQSIRKKIVSLLFLYQARKTLLNLNMEYQGSLSKDSDLQSKVAYFQERALKKLVERVLYEIELVKKSHSSLFHQIVLEFSKYSENYDFEDDLKASMSAAAVFVNFHKIKIEDFVLDSCQYHEGAVRFEKYPSLLDPTCNYSMIKDLESYSFFYFSGVLRGDQHISRKTFQEIFCRFQKDIFALVYHRTLVGERKVLEQKVLQAENSQEESLQTALLNSKKQIIFWEETIQENGVRSKKLQSIFPEEFDVVFEFCEKYVDISYIPGVQSLIDEGRFKKDV